MLLPSAASLHLILARSRLRPRTLLCLEVCGALSMTFILLVSSDALVSLGLDMSVLALGTCWVMMAGTQKHRKGMSPLRPLRSLGRRSHEISLGHMFVVIGLFQLLLWLGKPNGGASIMFALVLII